MTVRQATPLDAGSIARIHVDAWRSAYAGILPADYLRSLSQPRRQERWEASLAKSTQGTIVVEDHEGGVVGWASFGASRDEDLDAAQDGELYAIYVDPPDWGSGFGRDLLSAVVRQLERDGFGFISLWVLRDNDGARGFYERHGFAPDGAEKLIEIGGVELVETRYRSALCRGHG